MRQKESQCFLTVSELATLCDSPWGWWVLGYCTLCVIVPQVGGVWVTVHFVSLRLVGFGFLVSVSVCVPEVCEVWVDFV